MDSQRRDKRLPAVPDDPGRLRFLTRLGEVAVLTAVSGLPAARAETEAVPMEPQEPLVTLPSDIASELPPEVPGTVSNTVVMAEKDAIVKIHTERPLTASAAAEFLNDTVTPTKRMFVRNNLLTPDINPATHRLAVTGLVGRPLDLSLGRVQKLESVTIHAMLECGGSGRTAFQPTPRGTPWPPDAGMGCAKWTGVRLRDILDLADVIKGGEHVAFIAADFGALPSVPPFVRSIPISKAMEKNTLIAWQMNGAPLPKVHGYPLRVLVPGWAGCASTKWLKEIRVLPEPYRGAYMDGSYRIPSSSIVPGEKMPEGSISAEAWPVKSIITSPAPNTKFKLGETIIFEGKAWAGENRVNQVKISMDEGLTWFSAWLGPRSDKYAWRPFSFEWRADRIGYVTCIARARDNEDNVQPIVAAWNPLGYFWNGVHRVGVVIDPA